MYRVLIVDHDSSTRNSVRKALIENLGCKVGECGDGGVALEALARNGYDLVITDLQLPMMSGIEMLTILRHQPRFRALPVIVLTERRDDPLVRRVVGLGVGDYLIKPVNTDRLCARARALLREHSPVGADSETATTPPPGAGRNLLPPLRLAKG